jgi:hypothetical protein
MSYPCPECHDRYTQSLPMVYNSGISTWTSQRGLASGSQTVLSSMTSPPSQRRYPRSLLAACLDDAPVSPSVVRGWHRKIEHLRRPVECPAFYVPVSVRETGAKGAGNGTRKEAYP